MLRNLSIWLFAAALAMPMTAYSQDARSILETAQKKQLERWEGVDVYVIDQSVVGHRTQTYFQRTEVEYATGESQTLFLPVSYGGQCMGATSMTAEALEAYARGAEMTGTALASGIEDGLAQAGLPRGLLAATGSDPTATLDPRVMMGSGAAFARAGADAQRQQSTADPTADAQETVNYMVEFMASARLVGTEPVDGRSAYHLRASDLDHVQQMDGEQFMLQNVSMWIDAEEYVPLKTKMDGTLTSAEGARPMAIENMQTDFRSVPGSKMYESYKRVMKISGMMDAAQEAEMLEAQQKMAEFEKEMASMPENQRQMMENMIGPQLEMMRKMASGGGFQSEIIVNSIAVNPEMTTSNGQPCS